MVQQVNKNIQTPTGNIHQWECLQCCCCCRALRPNSFQHQPQSIKELYIINDLNVRKYSHIKSRRVQTCCDTLNHRHSSSSWIKDQSVTRVIMWGIPLNDAAFLQAGKLHYQTSVWRNAVKNKKSRM